MEWIFGQLFHSTSTGVVRPCDATEAERRHRAKEGDYCAVLRNTANGRSIAAVEVSTANRGCNVHFLDNVGRTYMRYLFVAAPSSQMFLRKTRFIEYLDQESKAIARSEVGSFHEDRTVRLDLFDEINDVHRVKNGSRSSVSGLYEQMPDFGDWASLMRTDRDAPLDRQPAESPSWFALETAVEF